MNKKVIIVVLILIICFIAGIIAGKLYKSHIDKLQDDNKHGEEVILKPAADIEVVPTMIDEISTDTAWCGTFQLVWNDMKNDVVKKDVIFNPQEKMAENLNKEEFTSDMLSDEYYFKTYGLKSLELKEQIEKGIKEKFDQESDILEDFDWSEDALNDPNNPNVRRYFFYVMLYRKFEFLKVFDVLDKGKFGEKYDNIKYFGIDGDTDNKVGDQIDVLYYNSKDDFAIAVNTKTNDQVIYCKSPKGETFKEIYENMNNEANKYTGSRNFKDIDEFKAPKLDFDKKREYTELQGKVFKTNDPKYDSAVIEKAIQSIKFSIDEKGGEIKSEAAIDMRMVATAIKPEPDVETPRYFYVDDTFAIFLKEADKDMPYFAGRIDDITKFQ